jgi:hypothetical protein
MLKTVGNPSTRFGNQTIDNGNLVFATAGNGIDFSANANAPGATSELLNDYETGTWTPTLSTTGTALTSVTYDPVTGGKYTKVGNLVHVQGIIRTDAVTVGSATGSVQISGLPFTSSANTGSTVNGSSGLVLPYSVDFVGEEPTAAVVGSNSTNAILYYRNAADGNSAASQVADLGTGANANFFYFSGTYIAA